MKVEDQNPLLKGLPKITDLNSLEVSLRNQPLKKIKIKNLNEMEKYELLDPNFTPFEPTSQAIQAALTINRMIKGSYRSRNPLLAKNKRCRNDLISQDVNKSNKLTKKTFGVKSAFGIIGITGLGKSLMIKRIMSMYPEALHHCSNQVAGYERLSQIVYLYVEMPGEGSRGGLIESILCAIDGVLGTTYATDYSKQYKTVDIKEIQIIILLHTFFVGLLIIDELQYRNIQKSTHSKVMQLFILTIINSGIPVLLAGNPLGFDWVNEFSQDARRVFRSAPVVMHPYPHPEDDDTWKEIYQGIRSHYVLDEYPKDENKMCHILWLVSGGIPGLAIIFWEEAQRLRLLKPSSKRLTQNDIVEAFKLEGFEKLRNLASGFSTQNPNLLHEFTDIPVQFYADRWGKPYEKNIKSIDESSVQNSQTEKSKINKRIVSEKTKMVSKKTKAKNKDLKREETKEQLTEDDIRDQMNGLQSVLLDGFLTVN